MNISSSKEISYVWPSGSYPYNLHKNRLGEARSLFLFRVFALIFHIITIAFVLYYEPERLRLLVFLTIWGFLISGSYFLLVTLETLVFKGQKRALWKACIVILEIAISLEFLITIFYWLVLFRIDYDRVTRNAANFIFNLFLHLFCYISLFLELLMNHIIFHKNHWVFIMLAMGLYGVINCSYTLSEEPVYPPINYKDVLSYIYMLIAMALAVGGFFIKCHFTTKYNEKTMDLENTEDSSNHLFGLKSHGDAL